MNHLAVKTNILAVQEIPNVHIELKKKLKLLDKEYSIGLITTDSDDVSYAALDEATKKAAVRVAYAKSMYAGAGNASTRLAGEFIGILAGPNPSEVKSGLLAARDFIENQASFYRVKENDSIVYFAHCISRSGTYLSKQARVSAGMPLAYVIAPPAEALMGIDAVLKAVNVKLNLFYGPPTETNFAGGLLSGDQAACAEACRIFSETVCRVGAEPIR